MYVRIHVTYLLVLSDFNKNLIYWRDFRKFHEFFHADEQKHRRANKQTWRSW